MKEDEALFLNSIHSLHAIAEFLENNLITVSHAYLPDLI